MSLEKETQLDDQFSIDLSKAFKTLGEASELTQHTDSFGRPHVNWEDFERKIEECLRKLKGLAEKHRADQLDIQAGVGWPPKVDVTLTFILNK